MQDRFKFRVWLKDRNKMSNVHSLHVGTNKAIVSSRHGNVSIYINRDAILMQCTGVKDKNGKLIYEGDILKFKLLEDFRAFGANEKYVEIIAPITYEYGGFFIEQSENSIFLGQLPMSEIEVIGNIYENSELLKDGE